MNRLEHLYSLRFRYRLLFSGAVFLMPFDSKFDYFWQQKMTGNAETALLNRDHTPENCPFSKG